MSPIDPYVKVNAALDKLAREAAEARAAFKKTEEEASALEKRWVAFEARWHLHRQGPFWTDG